MSMLAIVVCVVSVEPEDLKTESILRDVTIVNSQPLCL